VLTLEENQDLESRSSIIYSKKLKDPKNATKILKSEAKIASELMTKYEGKTSLSLEDDETYLDGFEA